MGWSVGRGCPLRTEEGVWGGGCAPSPENFKKFLGSMCSKNFCVQAKGGASPSGPPKYATASLIDCYARRIGVLQTMNSVCLHVTLASFIGAFLILSALHQPALSRLHLFVYLLIKYIYTNTHTHTHTHKHQYMSCSANSRPCTHMLSRQQKHQQKHNNTGIKTKD